MAEENSRYIPIPQFPPFKLRSSLIDKDPVIWVHLLEAYIRLFQFLVASGNSNTLSVKSQQQLQIFLKVYLAETADESTRIFSLGNINPDIKKNTSILRSYVFQYIKTHSIVKAKLSGESVWNFIRIYVQGNSSMVRGLVDGSYQSVFNDNKKSGNISCIGLVQTYLESLITNNKFTAEDLTTLSYLLGQYTKSINKSNTFNLNSSVTKMKVTTKKSSSSNFAEKFVDVSWIEMLEKLYGNGSSIHSKVIEKIMTVSVLSLSAAKLSKLATELNIFNAKALSLFPLFSTIIISDTYKELIPGLEERLPFLRNLTIGDSHENLIVAEEGDIQVLLDFFPQMTVGKAKTILEDNNNNVEYVTNLLLENPDQISLIKEKVEKKKPVNKSESKDSEGLIFTKDDVSNHIPSFALLDKKEDKTIDFTQSEEFKKKSLSTVLNLIYQDDEDEPDDTYLENEATSGEAIKVNQEDRYSEIQPEEMILFSSFRHYRERVLSDPEVTTELKRKTGMDQKKIEKFFQKLLSTPKMMMAFEEAFFYGGESNKGIIPKTGYTKVKEKKQVDAKITRSRDEKNKAKRANHKRKAGHGKKVASNLIGMQN